MGIPRRNCAIIFYILSQFCFEMLQIARGLLLRNSLNRNVGLSISVVPSLFCKIDRLTYFTTNSVGSGKPIETNPNFAKGGRFRTNSEIIKRKSENPREYISGEMVSVKVIGFSQASATVTIEDDSNTNGFVQNKEISLFCDQRQSNLRLGETLKGWVNRTQPDGTVNIRLRGTMDERIISTSIHIIEELLNSNSNDIPLGKKSSPEEIARYFPGVSKHDFKKCLSSLFTLGLIGLPGSEGNEYKTALKRKPESLETAKVEIKKHYFDNKTVKPEHSLFIGNLNKDSAPQKSDLVDLLNGIIDRSAIVDIRLATDPMTGEFRGFAFIDFETALDSILACNHLDGHELFGRKLAVTDKSKGKKLERSLNDSKSGNFDNDADFDGYDRMNKRKVPRDSLTTLYFGNLSYHTKKSDLQKFVEDFAGNNRVCASVRLGTEKGSNKPRGFAHIDFYSRDVAKSVYDSLHGQTLLGRKLIIDITDV
jgi:RNA recognition motif-containing protein